MQTYGAGPWFVFLVTHAKTQQSIIYAHSYPELIVQTLNVSQEDWFLHVMIGPFDNWQTCQTFLSNWGHSKQTKTRLKRAYYLFHNGNHNLHMWICKEIPVPCAKVMTSQSVMNLISDHSITIENIKHIDARRNK
jgi:hypothetical protein